MQQTETSGAGMSRRGFVAALAALAPVLAGGRAEQDEAPRRPPRLPEGGTIGLVSPGGAVFDEGDLAAVEDTLARLGFRTRRGEHVLDQRGYLAGADADRADDLHRMFMDPRIDAVLTMRGGYGCARILPLLDYDLIARRPKPLIGFSDVTALLLAVYRRCNLVTFHGPVGISSWNDFTTEHFLNVVVEGRPFEEELRGRTAYRTRAIGLGVARGRLAGGNLTVLASLLGTPYLPDLKDALLFLEDTGEEPYRIDRLLMQLDLAGVLADASGVLFGTCTRCDPASPGQSLSLDAVLEDHLRRPGVPAFQGAPFGHTADKLTLPLGVPAELDTRSGRLRLLEPAVA